MKPRNPPPGKALDPQAADRVVAQALRTQSQRELTYRERALKIYPWICGRCTREFTPATVRMLTVHHRDHDHENNPPDGSNWELLCLYCHDNEHSRQLEQSASGGTDATSGKDAPAAHKAFAGLASMLKVRK